MMTAGSKEWSALAVQYFLTSDFFHPTSLHPRLLSPQYREVSHAQTFVLAHLPLDKCTLVRLPAFGPSARGLTCGAELPPRAGDKITDAIALPAGHQRRHFSNDTKSSAKVHQKLAHSKLCSVERIWTSLLPQGAVQAS
ncbi:hypothetical protein GQ602_003209 [Ophiocordyceps camponoti-floridani]|uniref:Uncharacterized protein n=1 Tax=Ophiocordyceps camponoti-floridani TaxID=2030778 RepID=A0A8H4VE33_9HYPO|nr:hypothetical protein GQ602_003209 [Ophiocordyceps camponoti-floridani]